MALSDLWTSSRHQLDEKSVSQVISFAGGGKLLDGSDASEEFRAFLSQVPSAFLARYADQCLTERFENSGLALQDVVNQIGKRLGFSVIDGRYRGNRKAIGFDGLWHSTDDHTIVVEVKTTDAYRIDLGTLSSYRRALIGEEKAYEDKSSILIVCGREDTGDLEAQIRGSRLAWDVRLISLDALLRLLVTKEALDNPSALRKIRDVLIPHEFTKVDDIIDLIFSTTEDVRQVDVLPESELLEGADTAKAPPVKFNDECIIRVEQKLKRVLVKRTQTLYSSPDGGTIVFCAVSKKHPKSAEGKYWFAFHPYQKQAIESASEGWVAFGCGSSDTVVLIPEEKFILWLDGMNVTRRNERVYWHVKIYRKDGRLTLHRRREHPPIDLAQYQLAV